MIRREPATGIIVYVSPRGNVAQSTSDPGSRVGSEETAILTKRFSGAGHLFIGGISNSRHLKF